ncbi:MAG: MFS transporter [Pseudomonadales bacterium]|nr:MFS transporter [Pseudomonadales bacterium]
MTHRLSVPTMVAYGFGQVAESIKNQGFNVFLLFYYNQVLQVSATSTAIALAIALIFVFVTDPVAGSLSDKLHSRWGRRHPFILFSAVPLAISFYLLFNPPVGLSEFTYVIWLAVLAILVRGSLTFYHVPHLALGAEMARDYDQRSTMYALSTFFGFMGAVVFIPVSYRVFFPTTEAFNPGLLNQDAYSSWAIFAGATMIFAVLVCVIGTRHEIPRLRRAENISVDRFSMFRMLGEVREVFKNHSFFVLFFGMVLSVFILSVEAVFNPFMGFHFWGMTTEQLAYIPVGMFAGLVFSVVLVPILTRRYDKKPTLIGCAALTIVNINAPIVLTLFEVSWFPEPGSSGLLLVLIISSGFTTLLAPIVFATLNSMFGDIADEHELDVGERREGVIFAARSFANKASASIGLVAGGILLDFIAFPRGALMGSVPAEIVWQLGFIAGPATSVFTLAGLALYVRYRIDRKRHAEIMQSLGERPTEDGRG